MTRHLLKLTALLWLVGCATSAVGAQRDAGDEPADEGALDAPRDALDAEASAPPDLPARPEVGVDAAADVARDEGPDRFDAPAEGGDDCERDPPAGPPAGTSRSCGEGGAPAWHCREVHTCGGTFQMGQLGAFEMEWPGTTTPRPMRACDLNRIRVHSGYIDAYEVTVARFRAWIRAGRPAPGSAPYFNGAVLSTPQHVLPSYGPNADDLVEGVPTSSSQCTYSDTPGVNDELPVNCVTWSTAVAFCWWDGKHLVTEAMWEFVARNGGTTSMPAGEPPVGSAACALGDVGGYAGLCTRRPLPMPVNSHPDGATTDPAGVHDLYGGAQEYTLGFPRPYNAAQPDAGCTPLRDDTYQDGFYMIPERRVHYTVVRGAAWFQNLTFHNAFGRAATRTRSPRPDPTMKVGTSNTTSVRVGFRCARWVPEPR